MESAITTLEAAIRDYNHGIQSQFRLDEYMEEVKSHLRNAVADINYAYGMIEPMPAGEPLDAAGNAMKENHAGGARQKRKSTRGKRQAERRRHSRHRRHSKRV